MPRATSYEFILRDPDGAAVQTSKGAYFKVSAARGTWTYQIRGIYESRQRLDRDPVPGQSDLLSLRIHEFINSAAKRATL